MENCRTGYEVPPGTFGRPVQMPPDYQPPSVVNLDATSASTAASTIYDRERKGDQTPLTGWMRFLRDRLGITALKAPLFMSGKAKQRFAIYPYGKVPPGFAMHGNQICWLAEGAARTNASQTHDPGYDTDGSGDQYATINSSGDVDSTEDGGEAGGKASGLLAIGALVAGVAAGAYFLSR